MTINSNESRKKGIALKTALLSMTLITATFYVYTTITPALAREGHFVRIGVTGYSPSSLTISSGDFVTWSNEDPSGSPPVTVTSDTGAFGSGDIKPGGGFNHTFDTPGTYKYSDKYHPSNKGEIIVT